ncbi:MAG: class I SAM-dependent methyltransferase [Acetobacter sp.]|nr:class I SAM-dependent methyltransferase [Acetobacter sp.]
METRIYSKTLTIQYDDVKSFYDKRAKEFSSGLLPKYTCTLLNDTDSHYAEKWHDFEVNTIKPYLNCGKILDIGCGIGRWADVLANECISYCGIDFSKTMIEAAKQRFSQKNINFFNIRFKIFLN